jgi:hypothetical protein
MDNVQKHNTCRKQMFELLHYKQQYICSSSFYDSVNILSYVVSNGRVIHK